MSRGGRPRAADLRMLAVAVVVWVAALVATYAPRASVPVAAALWGASLVGLVAARRWRVLAIGAVALACAAAVVTHVAVAVPERDRLADLPVGGGRALALDLTVTGKVERTPAGWRFDAVTDRATVAGTTTAIVAPVVVRASERPAGLELGARVRVTGSAFRTDPGDRAVLVVDASRAPEVRDAARGVLAVAAELRRGLLARTEGLPQPGSGLIAGLAVGDTERVDAALDADMKTASLSHLTAVSGANCALVVGIAFGAAALAGLRRRARVAVGLAALVAFVVLVSPEPSVVRAAAMAAIAMLAVLLGRTGAGAAVLGLAVTVCLIFDPWLAATLGFALSAVATAALVLVAGPFADALARVMPHPLALALAVPLAAQLACTPILVIVDPRLPLWSVLANVLAAPAAPVATVLGLAACLAAPIPLIASGLAAIAWVPCAWIAATAHTVAALPASSLPWWTGAGGVAVAALLCAAAGVVVAGRGPRALRAGSGAVVAIVAGALVGSALVDGPVSRMTAPQDWAVAACDVGQGDAVLLRSGGRVALVDTGPDPVALSRCLDRFGVDRVDLLVLTHFDLDHRGGADAVLGRVDILLHGPIADPADAAVVERFARAGAHATSAHAGMSGRLGEAEWNVLWPRPTSAAFPPGNDASIVLDARGGGIPSILLLGDLSAAPQQALRARLRGPYDIVKVAHHGSADQDDELYRRAAPAVALVTVGENDYGHPRAEILGHLAALGAAVVRTDRTGAAAVSTTGGTVRVWRERAPTDVEGAG